ncbi:hypothetical protein F4780DRAFT_766389 [Xylariomycetidae sp. FL0641]|nr:hypothetical protein F4780DRAFT_766389 [Xylariomycetidae sp. FL0641]
MPTAQLQSDTGGGEHGSGIRRLHEQRRLLFKGQQMYIQGKFSVAAERFVASMRQCSCGVGYNTRPCTCKDVLKGIANGTLVEQLKTACTCAAKSYMHCAHPDHVDALDCLAATCEKVGRLDLAINIAVILIILAPREARGYLRLTKVLRLQEKESLALRASEAGIALVAKKNPEHPLLENLRNIQAGLKRKSLKRDPLKEFPTELVAMIFGLTDFRDLRRCLRVSKSWNAFFTRSDPTIQALWRRQRYVNPKQLTKFKRFSRLAGHTVTDLAIAGPLQGAPILDLSKVLRLCENLQGLSITLLTVLTEMRLESLVSLHLGYMVSVSTPVLNVWLQGSCTTLRELSLHNLPGDYFSRFLPHMPALEYLRLDSRQAHFPDHGYQCFWKDLVERTPSLKHLWLDNLATSVVDVSLQAAGADFQALYRQVTSFRLWPGLQSLSLGPGLTIHAHGLPLLLPPTLREVYLYTPELVDQFSMPALNPDSPFLQHEVIPRLEPRNLENLYLVCSSLNMETRELQHLVKPGLTSGSLKKLALREVGHLMPVPAYTNTWFRSDHLTYLALSGFTMWGFQNLDEYILELVLGFPALRVLDVSAEKLQYSTVQRLLLIGLETIYIAPGNPYRLQVQEWGREVVGDHIEVVEGPSPEFKLVPTAPSSQLLNC